MYELIITEKPKASQKIADALADGKSVKRSENGVPYYQIKRKGKDIVVGCAVGHLFTLAEKKKNGWTYPVFDIEWQPTHKISKESKFSKKYLDTLKKLSKGADSFTIACDYDIEGEIIGYNVLRFICKQKDAHRMKFSTLTKPELEASYENASQTLDWGQVEAGETRHELDYYYGINLSRALTASVKAAGAFKILSSGRVQGPALKIVVDREKEIKAFVPRPFWQIQLHGQVERGKLEAWHEADKFWEKDKADAVMQNVRGEKTGKVADVKKSTFKQPPPVPFDLTTLQTEAYRCHRVSPKETLSIAQELYIGGFISYPRTSSQQLPPSIGYQKILAQLARQDSYAMLAKSLMAKTLNPNNGKKSDPAHPAIYPTGLAPEVSGRQQKIYDLIVKRFMATFAQPAVRQSTVIRIDVKNEIFVARGTTTVERGWHIYYEPYVKLDEEELPLVEANEAVGIRRIDLLAKETQPPKRYTPASIIRDLEKRNLGTKSTRAQIVDTLYQRGYVSGKVLEATQLGIGTVDTLEKYSPKILDEALTRHFEEEMENIREKKKKRKDILDEAESLLKNMLVDFRKNESEIGKELAKANRDTMNDAATMGTCPNCEEGQLAVRKGKFGRFLACNQYPKCKTTFSLPKTGMVKRSANKCKSCDHIMISIIRKGKKPQEVCINPDCPDKEVSQEAKEISENGGKKCPNCSGKMVLRKSVYGQFYGCSNYPKCKTTEKVK
ncbi:MAG: DNA topoisomerase I [archaeon]